jgi:hypothetical protein
MGIQPENSVIDTLLRTISPIATSISKWKTTNLNCTRPAILTLDIEGTFNQVHPSTLLEIIYQHRMPVYLTNWIVTFKTDQKIAFRFHRQSDKLQSYRYGQGSSILPILFLIYSNM